jgi:stearoyl-CoA desaturase (delta-9 desaturase)
METKTASPSSDVIEIAPGIEAPAPPDAPLDVPPTNPVSTGVMLAVVVIPFVAFLTAIALLWNRAVSWTDLAIFVGMYVPAALGITVGYHRMLTHRAFEASGPVRAFFLAWGSMAVEGGALSWAVDHRTHHAFSDKEGDPHSPHVGRGSGVLNALGGLWHAHAGWMFDSSRRRKVEKYGKDLLQDPIVVFFERTFIFWAVLSFVIPALAGYVLSGFELKGLLTGLLWGGFVRVFFNHHVTWSINSICHFFGNRPFKTTDLATNNWLLAIPSMGESWHHNHHVFPTSAYHGLGRKQIDLSALLIRGLEKAGLVWNVRKPSSEQIDRKLLK